MPELGRDTLARIVRQYTNSTAGHVEARPDVLEDGFGGSAGG